MLHDSTLYKLMIEIDIDICCQGRSQRLPSEESWQFGRWSLATENSYKTLHSQMSRSLNSRLVVVSALVASATSSCWYWRHVSVVWIWMLTQARFPFKCTQCKRSRCVRCVKNRIDSIVAFSCARSACFAYQLRDLRLRTFVFACVIFLRLLRFLRTFYFACVY